MHSLADSITFEEFNNAIDKVYWDKSLGINGVSPNMIKALNVKNRWILFRFI